MEKEVIAFIDTNACVTVGEEVFGATVRFVSCHLLIPKGVHCPTCYTYRKNLQTQYQCSIVKNRQVKSQKINLGAYTILHAAAYFFIYYNYYFYIFIVMWAV